MSKKVYPTLEEVHDQWLKTSERLRGELAEKQAVIKLKNFFITLSLALGAALIVLSICFARSNHNKKVEIGELNKRIDSADHDIARINRRVIDLKERLAIAQKASDDAQSRVDELQKSLDFYESYVVIRSDDGTGIFHKYGCDYLSTEHFWIYNINAAFSQGYDPCVHCIKSGYYIGNRNSKVFHKPTCGTLPYMENRKYFESESDAIDSGYRPCNLCSP